MNIVMYGFELDTVRGIAEEYGFTLCGSHRDFGRTGNRIFLQSRRLSAAEEYEFIKALEDSADNIDTVIASDAVTCCMQPWKFFSIDASDEPEYEIRRIIESHLGLICAHEGI